MRKPERGLLKMPAISSPCWNAIQLLLPPLFISGLIGVNDSLALTIAVLEKGFNGATVSNEE